MLYLAEGPGSARIQVGLSADHSAELQGHTLETWQRLHAKDLTSRFLGVCQAKNGRWRMQARLSKGRVHRICQTEEEAASAYDLLVLQDKGRCKHASATLKDASVLCILRIWRMTALLSFVHRLAIPVMTAMHLNCMRQPVCPTMQMQGQLSQPASIPRKMPSLAEQVISYTFCCAGRPKPI